jgi:exopolysaccharide biosynthesis polyprenyl glycosylphosphotransferase
MDAVGAVAVLAAVVTLAGGSLTWPVLLAAPLTVALLKLAGLYDRDELLLNRTTLDEVPQLVQIGALSSLLTWLLADHLLHVDFLAVHMLALWLGGALVLLIGRAAGRRLTRRLSPPQRCLLVGAPDASLVIRRKLREAAVDAHVACVLDATSVHDRSELARAIRQRIDEYGIDRVIVAPTSSDAADMLEVIRVAKLHGVRVTVLPRLFEVIGSAIVFDHVGGLTMLGVRRFGLSRSSRAVKRAFDLAGVLLLLLAVAPLMVVIALLIRLDGPGPVFFRQTRIGRDGRPFQMLKFRSMGTDAEERKEALRPLNEVEGLFKIAADPRITRVGRWLRRSSLDELPQLLNVLKGEMSLVGPRPLVVDEDALILGLDRARLHLTPGMTGPWQVLGSGRVPLAEMVNIDYLYAANWSLWTDVKLLLRTIPHVLGARGR